MPGPEKMNTELENKTHEKESKASSFYFTLYTDDFLYAEYFPLTNIQN